MITKEALLKELIRLADNLDEMEMGEEASQVDDMIDDISGKEDVDGEGSHLGKYNKEEDKRKAQSEGKDFCIAEYHTGEMNDFVTMEKTSADGEPAGSFKVEITPDIDISNEHAPVRLMMKVIKTWLADQDRGNAVVALVESGENLPPQAFVNVISMGIEAAKKGQERQERGRAW